MDTTRQPRWMRRLQRRRRTQAFTVAALAAMFAATGCASSSSGGGSAGQTAESTTTSLGPESTTTSSSTSTSTTARRSTSTEARRSTTTSSSTTSSSTTSSTRPYATCETHPDGTQTCVVEGRPLRRKRRRGLLLPEDDVWAGEDADARTEYASVAAFGELALRLIALGAPADLVEACHLAALDEIRHARAADGLAGRSRARFGAIPALLGRRIGGGRRLRSRAAQLRAIAVESFVDGWLNEGAAACRLRARADAAATDEARAVLSAMAADEQRHADLARQIVEWCFGEDRAAVGPALAAVAAVGATA